MRWGTVLQALPSREVQPSPGATLAPGVLFPVSVTLAPHIFAPGVSFLLRTA